MITREFAVKFAEHWIESWNSHDLKQILSHYTEDLEMSSPYIVQIAGEASGMLKGKEAVGAYWAKALERMPALREGPGSALEKQF
ncbi:MAG: nuclear transport factor 2 family protein [Kiritimatiellae bacterium]|nr:nuclear transport factor 2 family protein [Kiritimatiellia bacterium]